MITLAIDPGASGGLAWIRSDKTVECCKMPDTEGDVVDLLRSLAASGIKAAYIERVGGFTGKGQPGSAMFNFGRGVGVLHGALLAMGVRVVEVTPQKWQKWLGMGTKGTRTGAEWKRHLKAEAQRRFPCQHVTLSTADALLLLDYALYNTPKTHEDALYGV